MEETSQAPQGKGLAITGFILALVAIVFFWIISPICIVQAAMGGGYPLAAVWLVVSIVATLLSFMGMKKLGATGGKKGLAMTGFILGIVAILLCAWLLYGVYAAQAYVGDAAGDFQNAMQELENLQ